MKTFTKIAVVLLLILTGLFRVDAALGQSILDPNDPVINYDENNPPSEPPYNQIGKWIRTKRLNWNTDAYKAYIYNGSAFRLKFPTTYTTAADGKRYPMVVMFHGRGEAGENTDNEYSLYNGGQAHLNAVNSGKFDGYVLFMQGGTGWGTHNFDKIAAIIEYMITNNKLDPFRISFHGLSAGGQGAWDMIVRYPKLVASALPMSGTHTAYKENPVVQSLKFTPIWDFQGGTDNNPAPYTSQQVADAFANAGGNFKHTVYTQLGHGVWNTAYAEADFFPFMLRAYKANPWALGGRTEFCPGDVINITIGVTAGFDAYEWRKNGTLISGASSNTLQVTSSGVYDCRIKRGALWSEWSPIPVNVIYKEPTVSPDITTEGVMSRVIPSPEGASVTLFSPVGYASYKWEKVGSTNTLGTNNTLVVSAPGDYRIRVTEQYGCSSNYSSTFTVVDANGPNKPDAPINVTVSTLSKTSLRLDWSQNPSPLYNETNFEVFRALQPEGPFKAIAILPADASNYIDTEGLNAGTTYYYIVRAVNNTSAAPVGGPVNGTTAMDTNSPTAPTDLRITGSSRQSISLGWSAATDDVEVVGYDIYVNGVKSYVTTDLSFIVFGLEENKTYTFKVKARDFAKNESPFSGQVSGQAMARGLSYKHYWGSWSVLPDFNALTPVATGTVDRPILDPRTRNENIGFLYEGFINVPATGNYTFRTNSDDGSKLYLGPLNGTSSPYSHTATALVNNDGAHGSQNRDGSVYLTAGAYPIAVSYFNAGGGLALTVSWTTPLNSSFTVIPASAFVDNVAPEGVAPDAPTKLLAEGTAYNKVSLTWKDNSNNEAGFEIFRSGSPAGIFSMIGSAPANAESYEDITVAPATAYYYKIRAVNNYGESDLAYEFQEVNWKFNNDLTDEEAGARALVPTGGPSYSTDKKEGEHAIKLNGTSQYLSINTADGYLKNIYSEKSVAFWMKSNVNTGNKVVFDLGGSDDGLAIRLDNNTLYAGIAANNNRRNVSIPYTSSDWNHIALVYKGSTLRLYVNGTSVGYLNDLAFTATTTTTNGSRIGLNDGSTAFNTGNARFSGFLDNFSIFGSALTSDDVVAHMNNTRVASHVITPALPLTPPVPSDLTASGTGTKSIQVNWAFNATTTTTTEISASTQRIEAEAYSVMSGLGTQTSSEGGLNLSSLDANDWADYNVNLPTGGACTFRFRVAATTANGTTNHFQVRNSADEVLATITIPRTGNSQVYTTVTTTIDLPAGPQTLRMYVLRNGWTFNWFEIETGSATNTNSVTSEASGFELYRSANNNQSYVLLAKLPADARSYADTGLFTNAVYYYKVKALNEGGGSEFSSEDSAATLNNIPVLTAIGNQVTRFGTQLDVNVAATDEDPETLTISYSNMPEFATYVSTGNGVGYIRFEPSESDQGTYTDIIVTVSDQHGGTHSRSFDLVVNDNYVPVIAPVANVSVNETETAQVALSAIDGNSSDELTWSFVGLPAFATASSNGGTAQVGIMPGLADHGDYTVKAIVSDGRGGVAERSFVITVVNTNPEQVVYIHFTRGGSADLLGPLPWNNTNKVPAKNDVFSNLKDDKGNVSPITLLVTSSWQALPNGTNTTGTVTGNNSGIYPDGVLKASYYTDDRPQSILIRGLDVNKKYNFTMLGTRSGTDNRMGLYTMKGVTQSLQAAGNTQNTISFNKLSPDADGTLSLTFVRASGSNAAYLNTLIIEEIYSDGTAPARPRDLSAQNLNAQVKLSWTDAAYNDTAYLVYRATNPAGPFTLLNAGATNANAQEFVDATVGGNTTYYYTVRAVNEYGEAYSDTVAITTENTNPVFAAISNVTMVTQQTVNINLSATDDPGDVVTFTAANLPSFATLTNTGNGTGTLSIAPGFVTGTFSNILVTASDGLGASVTRVFSIVVNPADPNAPTELTAAGATRTSVKLLWKDNSTSETGFQVYRAASANGSYSLVGTVAANTTVYVDQEATTTGKNYYKVRAVLGGSYSGYSNVIGSTVAQSQFYINFNDEYPAPLPWNNTQVGPIDGNVLYLKDEVGTLTSIKMEVVGQGWVGVNHTGMVTGNNSGVVPDNVMRNSYFLNTGTEGIQKFTGLDISKTYSFTFFGSRDGSGIWYNRTGVYSIGDKSVTLNAINNTSETATIDNVKPDADGSITVTVRTGTGSTTAYLGAIIFQGYASESPEEEAVPDGIVSDASMAIAAVTTSSAAVTIEEAKVNTTVNVTELKISDRIQVTAYPNPFIEDVTVKITLEKQINKLTLSVTDMTGRTILTKDLRSLPVGTSLVKLGLSSRLTPGVYLIRLIDGEGNKPQVIKVLRSK